MGNRQIPKGLEESDFYQKIGLLESLFGSKWLNSKTAKPSLFKQLWHRRDSLASRELYIISEAMQRFNTPENAAWFSDYISKVKKCDNQATISGIYELVSACMFDEGDQKATLCSVNHPGYDFVITIDNKRILVSCKRLTSSKYARSFYEDSVELYNFALNTLRKLGLNGLEVYVLEDRTKGTISTEKTKKAILDCLQSYKANSNALESGIGLKHNELFIAIRKIPNQLSGWQYYPGEISLIFTYNSPYFPKEQERFQDLFRHSANKLKKHTGSGTENAINIIMIGLPVSVSLAQAKEWLSGKFKKEHTSITGVMLNRLVPVTSNGPVNPFIVCDVDLIANPQAKVEISHFLQGRTLKAATLGDGITENESETWFMAGNEKIRQANGYLFQRGQVFHEHEYSAGEVHYHFPSTPGVRYYPIFNSEPGIPFKTSHIDPPEMEFVIL